VVLEPEGKTNVNYGFEGKLILRGLADARELQEVLALATNLTKSVPQEYQSHALEVLTDLFRRDQYAFSFM